ncbi:hypothetical protein Cgig2_003780 [Carnegiea gigantea]|uniref:Neprosin PEP catalytic domain-containing protein n=1 Tax=Carnegiea gigantea TaxID=171969 RepID=A0A9Q1JTN6_9CARY|nr:hypothetical protein Cgig2_003780 [Carnegiea gigantea]
MKPTSRPKWLTSQWRVPKRDSYNISHVQLNNGGCPRNTVPIRRMSEEDIARANVLSKNTISQLEPGIHRAIVQTKRNPSTIGYNGIGAWFSVWNPSTEPYQYSSAQFLIQNGLDGIQAGWMVNPTLYKDNNTHMFIHTTTVSLCNTKLSCYQIEKKGKSKRGKKKKKGSKPFSFTILFIPPRNIIKLK